MAASNHDKKVQQENFETSVDLLQVLNKNNNAKIIFNNFSPSHKREYVKWITEAKSAATRERRIFKMIEMLLGKK